MTDALRPVETLWYSRCPVPTAFTVALHLGWLEAEFENDGIAVTSLRQAANRQTRESHFSHTLDDSFRYGGNIPPIWAKSEGADTKLIGLSWIDAPHLILAMPGSGIRTAADLKGRRLSLPRRTNDLIDFWRAGALRTYETALASVGLTLDDVTLVDLPIGRTFLEEASEPTAKHSLFGGAGSRSSLNADLFALVRGEVDAIFTESSFGTNLKRFIDATVVYDSHAEANRLSRTNNAIPQLFSVSGGLLRDRPDLVARVLARIIEAGKWAEEHRADVVRFTALEAGVPEDIVEATYPALHLQLATDLGPENLEAIRLRKQFLLAHGFIRADFDLEDWTDHNILAQANAIVQSRAPVDAPRLAAVG
jgi:ABC-type nitrate/sulfonate/bicarbonate transport system substrate-binding protein